LFKNMKLSVRLGIGFCVILLLMVAIIIVVFFSMNSIQASLQQIVGVNVQKLNLYQNMSQYIYRITNNTRDMILLSDQAEKEKLKEEMGSIREEYDAAWQEILKLPVDENGKELQRRISEAVTAGRPLNDKVVQHALAENDDEAISKLLSEADPAMDKWQDLLNEAVTLQNEHNEEFSAEAANASSTTLVIIIFLGALSIILGAAIAVIVTRSITKPINRIADSLAEGAQQVASASNQLSSSSQQLAEGNAEQASSIEETSSTLEESASMVQQNSENTKQAAQLAAQTKAASDKGNAEMQEMMDSMSEIKKSSDQISKIIKVIDEIAFQTNILALNAAVEAARAGDAGMGFAVVAEEVRNLAQRSAQAAKDTAAIIESNIELSEKGVNVAKRVGESLNEITVQAKKVNELMDEIAAASQEQSQGISQINKAISQMEQVTQQNAASAEESASASEELSAQAQNLRDIVQQLVYLVNGSSGQDARYTEASKTRHNLPHSEKSNRGIKPAAPPKRLQTGLHTHDENMDAKRSEKGTYIVNPEEVIPLEDDSKDF
jgi:methyl-accepting chemotaxis protein